MTRKPEDAELTLRETELIEKALYITSRMLTASKDFPEREEYELARKKILKRIIEMR
jgi:hypothetical protein